MSERIRTLDIVGRRNWYFLLSLAIILPGRQCASTANISASFRPSM